MTILFILYIFWLLFIVIMAARPVWRNLPILARVLLAPAALVALVLDVAMNITLATLVFADLPKEALLSDRFIRYKAAGGWRGAVSSWICRNLLDPFQVGGHCH